MTESHFRVSKTAKTQVFKNRIFGLRHNQILMYWPKQYASCVSLLHLNVRNFTNGRQAV